DLGRRRVTEPVWLLYRVPGVTWIKADGIPVLAKALDVPPYAFFEDPTPPASAQNAELGDSSVGQLAEAEREFIGGMVELLTRYRQRVLGEVDPKLVGAAIAAQSTN